VSIKNISLDSVHESVSSMLGNVGLDIINIKEIETFLESPEGIILTPAEWEEIKYSVNVQERLAGKFAAKEAVMKLLGKGMDSLEFLEIEILNNTEGRPLVYLNGNSRVIWDSSGFEFLNVSISHHKSYAVAVATVE